MCRLPPIRLKHSGTVVAGDPVTALDHKAELELIDRARQGSVDAFEQLVFNYQDRLYRFLLVRATNRADAEDVLQDTFVAVFKYLPSYRPKYRFSTWLFTIAFANWADKGSPPESADSPDSVACEHAGPEQLGIQIEQQRSTVANGQVMPG